MKKPLTLVFRKLHNAEHFQYMTEFRDLLIHFNPAALKIMKLFTPFMNLYTLQDVCFMIIRKSNFTELLNDADRYRDSLWKVLINMIDAATKHFSADVVAAAKRVKVVADTYGNLANLPKDKETSLLFNFTDELMVNYAADIELIGATAALANLKESNDKYELIVKERDAQTAQKPDEKMKDIRVDIEEAYYDIVGAVEALGKLTDIEIEQKRYDGFITELNVVATRYKNLIAQREGVATAKKEKEDENPEIVTSEDLD